jgi:uncharacterized protein YegP (UPF0339 family)
MIEILKTNKGQFYYRVKAKNGKILCHSETYTRKQNVLKAIKAFGGIWIDAQLKDRT